MSRAGEAAAWRPIIGWPTQDRAGSGEPPCPKQFFADASSDLTEALISRAKEQGYLTQDEVNTALATDRMSSEQIEDAMTTLSELGIDVVENEDADEPAPLAARGAAEMRGNIDDDTGRTDDPVRLYLREMGSLEAIVARGRGRHRQAHRGRPRDDDRRYLRGPLTLSALMLWRDALNDGTTSLRAIIDLDAAYRDAMIDQADPDAVVAAAADRGRGRGRARSIRYPRPKKRRPRLNSATAKRTRRIAVSRAMMEAALRPGVVAILDQLSGIHKRSASCASSASPRSSTATSPRLRRETRYDRVKDAAVALLRRIRFNNGCIERLAEQLYDLNRRLVGEEGRLLRLAETAGVKRAEFLQKSHRRRAVGRLAGAGRGAARRTAGRGSPRNMRMRSPSIGWRSHTSRWKRSCPSANSAASCRPSSAASARPAGPRRKWSRPICGSSSRSPRSTRSGGLQFPDLIQEGNIGLMRAVDKFSTAAATNSRPMRPGGSARRLTRSIADQARTIRIPVHMVDNLRQLRPGRRTRW